MYRRTLESCEKALGPEQISKLNKVINPVNLYAEAMYRWALEAHQNAWGPKHTSTLGMVNDLGILCVCQGKMEKADAMYRRALEVYDSWGPEHTSTLETVNNLGVL